MLALDPQLDWPDNVWMGVSVETQRYLFRVDHLRQTHACVKFLSLEPLLGPLPGLDLAGIAWAIVGGESGPGARPMDAAWVREIRDRYLAARVPFFFKQWGGARKKQAGRLLDGRTWEEMPFVGQTSPQKARDAAEVAGYPEMKSSGEAQEASGLTGGGDEACRLLWIHQGRGDRPAGLPHKADRSTITPKVPRTRMCHFIGKPPPL